MFAGRIAPVLGLERHDCFGKVGIHSTIQIHEHAAKVSAPYRPIFCGRKQGQWDHRLRNMLAPLRGHGRMRSTSSKMVGASASEKHLARVSTNPIGHAGMLSNW